MVELNLYPWNTLWYKVILWPKPVGQHINRPSTPSIRRIDP